MKATLSYASGLKLTIPAEGQAPRLLLEWLATHGYGREIKTSLDEGVINVRLPYFGRPDMEDLRDYINANLPQEAKAPRRSVNTVVNLTEAEAREAAKEIAATDTLAVRVAQVRSLAAGDVVRLRGKNREVTSVKFSGTLETVEYRTGPGMSYGFTKFRAGSFCVIIL